MNQIYWLLIGDEKTPSSRIQGYNIHNALLRKGFNSIIIVDLLYYQHYDYLTNKAKDLLYEILKKGDILILQKVKFKTLGSLISRIKHKGVRVFLLDCDMPITELPCNSFEKIIVPSSALKDAYEKKGFKNVNIIPDALETEVILKEYRQKSRLNAVWFGTANEKRWNDEVKYVKRLAGDQKDILTLKTISNYKEADYRWDKNSLKKISNFDVALIPVSSDILSNQYKSSNRVTQSMALGLAVIASPLQAYENVIDHKKNGLICKSFEDWQNAIRFLHEPKNFKTIIENGYKTAQRYSLENLIDSWIEVLGLDSSFQTEATPNVKILNEFKNEVYRGFVRHHPLWYKYWIKWIKVLGLSMDKGVELLKKGGGELRKVIGA